MNQPTTQRNKRNRHAAMLLVVAGVLVSGACGNGGDGSDPPQGSPNSGNEVTMQLIAYKPEMVTVQRGATVTWTQKDAGSHTVTSGAVEQGGAGVTPAPDGRFDSGELATGETFRFTFDQPGTYQYFCSIHPATMRGEVRVS